ncbi:DUF2802 domain-containing protein [Psychrobium sp. MM17-31]|uniref:DUF2802 domain-containing protein n=1 Tax=Psychrobium sp. MM17-31 TaxID=2917758 RepID=UPI001EF584A6|nr:DUF2802 domain-containing protein [Psychrobium sp. MM17-31]MCG7530065.1 DUF2802 domain-containing protein [Psychrobium sp. MM17-31]
MNSLFLWIIPVVLFLAIIGLWLALQKRQRQISALKLLFHEQQRQIATIKDEIHELRNGTLGVGSRVQDVEGKLAQAMERQEQLSQVNTDPQSKLYGHAMKMVELGANVEDIMKECDLPRGEAELLVSLHGK